MIKKAFPQISPSTWEHPADKAAYSVIKQIPGVDEIFKALGKFTTDRAIKLMYLGAAVKVSGLQIPRVYKAVNEAARILDVAPAPEAFVLNSPNHNAMVIGINDPFIVITSSMVEAYSDEELLGVIGHEMAHLKAGHGLYNTILYFLMNISFQLFPMEEWVKTPIILALKDWQRKSEFSCDRAGLLCMQNPQVGYRLLLKSTAGGLDSETDLEEMFKQGEEYDKSPDIFDSITKILNVMESDHPLPVQRLLELRRWVDSGAYQKIMDGEYVQVGQETDPGTNMKNAFEAWEKDLNDSQDPAAQMAARLVKEAKKAGEELEKFFKGLF